MSDGRDPRPVEEFPEKVAGVRVSVACYAGEDPGVYAYEEEG